MPGEVNGAVIIRGAVSHDVARLADLLTQLGYPVGPVEVGERLGYWLPDPMSRVLVAERDGKVIGCVSAHANPYFERTGRWLRIDSLIVDEAERGTGVGRALLAAVDRVAGEWGCTAVEVTSSRTRPGAHAFYARLGFRDACERSARFFRLLDGAVPGR